MKWAISVGACTIGVLLMGPAAGQEGGGTADRAAVPVPMDGPAASAREAVNAAEIEYLVRTYERGLAELALGGLALEQAESPQVREMARSTTDLHERLNDELKGIAADAGVDLPRRPSADDQRLLARMQTLDPPALDQAYLFDRAQNLMRQVNLLEKLEAQADRQALRQLAAEMLPEFSELQRQAVGLRAVLAPVDDGPVGAAPGEDEPITDAN